MEEHYNERSIRRVLPESAKREYNTDKRYSDKMSDFGSDTKIEDSIIKEATRIGGTCHVTVPIEWLGKKIRCTPID